MTKRLTLLAIAAALSGCFLTYDPETVPLASSGLAVGAACGADPQCATGSCADGFCCDSSCGGQCEACDVAGAEGNCVAVTGAPHGARAACGVDGSGCGGTCDGTQTSSCDYPTTLCRPQSCTDSTQTYAAFCNNGSCPASSTQPCEPYACGATGCKNGCTVEADCSPGNYCPSGSCVPKLLAGATCSSAPQCLSGFCSPDGKCCDSACTGSCESCNGVNTGASAGTCAPILAGQRPDPAHTQCMGDVSGICAASCDGTTTGICSYPAISCRDASCATGIQISAASCNGGSCPAPVTAACSPYVCGATACKGSCTASTDCDSDSYCSGTSCVPKLANASPCSASEQCINGQCADNVCCNAACGGCKACNVAGYVGTCSNVPAGQDPHGTCSITSCQSACNGAGACGPAAAGETCASNSCVNQPPDATAYGRPSGANANVASCNGSTQSCPSPAPSSCSGHTCDGDQCNLSCIDNSDCVADTVCVGGECQACASSADCYSGAPLCTLTPYGTACDCAGDPDCFEGRGCNNGPGDCTLAGMGSVCVATFYCACNTGDGACNGRAPRCIASPGGSCSCGTVQGSICRVGQLCTDATASGTCKIAPGFPCTAVPADCASGTCGAGGLCTQLPAGKPCAHGSECTSGLCGAGWVCT